MTTYSKPLPDIGSELDSPFWIASRQSKLVIQRCSDCSEYRWPPLAMCPECYCTDAKWSEVPPVGVLWSYARYHRALDSRFGEDVPYIVGLVHLDAGPRMYGTILGATSGLGIGSQLHAVFEPVTDSVTFVRWRCA